jgi:hypothetical protein
VSTTRVRARNTIPVVLRIAIMPRTVARSRAALVVTVYAASHARRSLT